MVQQYCYMKQLCLQLREDRESSPLPGVCASERVARDDVVIALEGGQACTAARPSNG